MRSLPLACRGRKFDQDGTTDHAVELERAVQPVVTSLPDGVRQVSCVMLDEDHRCVLSKTRDGLEKALCFHLYPERTEILGDDSTEEGMQTPPDFVDRKIEKRDFCVRTFKVFGKAEITSIGELLGWTPSALLARKNFGETSLNEVRQFLGQRGLFLKDDKPAQELLSIDLTVCSLSEEARSALLKLGLVSFQKVLGESEHSLAKRGLGRSCVELRKFLQSFFGKGFNLR